MSNYHLMSAKDKMQEGGRGGGGVESREINKVFHDSSKFSEDFHVSRKISAGWDDCRALGTICNGRRFHGSIVVGDQGAKPPETSEIWHFLGTK